MIIQSIILLAFAAAFMLLAVHKLKAHTLKERHALVFIMAAIPLLVLAAWPALLERISEWAGISYSTILLMCACTFFVYMILELLSLISKMDEKIITLAQTIAIQNEREQARHTERPDAPPGQDTIAQNSQN